MLPEMLDSRAALRARMRQWRATRPAAERQAAAAGLAAALLALPAFRRARRIAGYRPTRGEIDPLPALASHPGNPALCWPVLDATGGLLFVQAPLAGPWRSGPHGIDVPASGEPLDPASLDLVLVPMVAAGIDGARLGQGGGHYDRAFGFRRQAPPPPLLLGVCYQGQVGDFARAPWDVLMDLTVSERGLLWAATTLPASGREPPWPPDGGDAHD